MKVVGVRIGYGMFPIHGEDEGGVCAGNSQSWALIMPGDVRLGPLVGDRCRSWLEVASLGGLGTQICAVLYVFLNVEGDTYVKIPHRDQREEKIRGAWEARTADWDRMDCSSGLSSFAVLSSLPLLGSSDHNESGDHHLLASVRPSISRPSSMHYAKAHRWSVCTLSFHSIPFPSLA